MASGTETGTVVISDGAGIQIVALSGTGTTAAQPNLSPASLNFGGVVMGQTSAAKTITLQNNGNQTLTIKGIAASGDFAQTNNCPPLLAATGSCAISVTFTPTVAGNLSGAVTLTDSASSSPQTVPLSGTGQNFSVSSFTTSETVVPGGGANYLLSVAPEGGLTGTASLSCSGAPTNSTCTVTPSSVTLTGSGYASATLQVTTTAPSAAPPLAPNAPLWPPATLWLTLAGCLAALATMTLIRGRRKLPSRWALGLALLGVMLWASCGGGPAPALPVSSGGTPAGTYTLAVTGTSGSLTHSITVSLNVQ
jgi:hypothetical protein